MVSADEMLVKVRDEAAGQVHDVMIVGEVHTERVSEQGWSSEEARLLWEDWRTVCEA